MSTLSIAAAAKNAPQDVVSASRDRPKLGRSWPASEEMRCQRFNDTRDKLRQLFKRWNDRLTLEEVSLSEAYIEGRLSIGLIVEIRGASLANGAAVNHHAELVGREWPRAVLVYEVQTSDKLVVSHDDEAMLIEVVQLVECPEGIISSFVRLYCLNDESAQVGSDLLFQIP
jgi:hypothetical protein